MCVRVCVCVCARIGFLSVSHAVKINNKFRPVFFFFGDRRRRRVRPERHKGRE